jgi:hypothetical protein
MDCPLILLSALFHEGAPLESGAAKSRMSSLCSGPVQLWVQPLAALCKMGNSGRVTRHPTLGHYFVQLRYRLALPLRLPPGSHLSQTLLGVALLADSRTASESKGFRWRILQPEDDEQQQQQQKTEKEKGAQLSSRTPPPPSLQDLALSETSVVLRSFSSGQPLVLVVELDVPLFGLSASMGLDAETVRQVDSMVLQLAFSAPAPPAGWSKL